MYINNAMSPTLHVYRLVILTYKGHHKGLYHTVMEHVYHHPMKEVIDNVFTACTNIIIIEYRELGSIIISDYKTRTIQSLGLMY